MKKSILSLSAAVALGGLGFAGAANAVAVFDTDGATATATILHPAGTGHQLFTPYYTAQGNMATLINLVNTDAVNGKAVKVRFRGAANSDDVLDFTLFLSPGDVWSGMVSQNADGRAQIITPDKSCTIPEQSAWPGVFSDLRLPSYATAEVKSALTREGYVEVLNMADVPPNLALAGGAAGTKANPLFTNIKHVAGVAPCSAAGFANLLTTSIVAAGDDATAGTARALGLNNPSGGLMGSWTIYQQDAQGAYSGDQTAIVATNSLLALFNGLYANSPANFAFAPQVGNTIDRNVLAANANGYPTALNMVTADPLLASAAPPAPGATIPALWFDLPDMSTPLVGTAAATQADTLSAALAKPNVANEYIATAAGAAVPFVTDWVVAQPTRRYHAAVNYASSSATAAIVNGNVATYYGDLSLRQTDYGPQACRDFALGTFDREEGSKVASGGFSPGTTFPYCGEVFVAQFGATSALQAAITVRNVNGVLAGQAGWGSLRTGVTSGLPVVGFAAIQFKNVDGGINYDATLPHRWTP